jgi:hypothetical protein
MRRVVTTNRHRFNGISHEFLSLGEVSQPRSRVSNDPSDDCPKFHWIAVNWALCCGQCCMTQKLADELQIESLSMKPKARICKASRTPCGEIYAVMARSRADNVDARFDTTSFTWTPPAPTPNPFSPRPASTDISNLWGSRSRPQSH